MSRKRSPSKPVEHDLYTIAEAAQYLRVTRATIYNYMANGLLPFYELKSGGGRRLRRADLDGLLTGPAEPKAD